MTAAVFGALIAVAPATDGPQGPRPHQVLLISGPIHYDFLLPWTPQTQAAFTTRGITPTAGPETKHLLVGWGARTFYTTVGGYTDVSARAVYRGVTGDTSVMRLDTIGALRPGLDLRVISMTDAQYARFLSAIINSFGATTPLTQSGFTATDTFYPAIGRFHILRTCNVWIGDMLRAAGVRFGLWTPLPLSVSVSHAVYHPE